MVKQFLPMAPLKTPLPKAFVEELRIEGYGLDENGGGENPSYVMSCLFRGFIDGGIFFPSIRGRCPLFDH